MNAGTLDHTGAPTTEACIYRNHRLLVWGVCDNAQAAGAIVEQASDLDHVYLLVHAASPDLGPGDVVSHEKPFRRGGKDQPLAFQQLPGYGTE